MDESMVAKPFCPHPILQIEYRNPVNRLSIPTSLWFGYLLPEGTTSDVIDSLRLHMY